MPYIKKYHSKDMTEKTIRMADLLGRQLTNVESKASPDMLFYEGIMNIPLPGPRVAIIGSRRASVNGLAKAKEIANVLIENKTIIISGLALGIDTAVHRASIEGGGRTIAVIGTPLNRTYPKDNISLQNELMKKHFVISQYQAGHSTIPKDFVSRNRTMAVISDAGIIVEAGDSGGSIYCGWEMLKLGRLLFICKEMEKREWARKMVGYGGIILDDGVLERLSSILPH